MKVDYFPEPLLEFGDGPHVDVRGGLTQYGPLDKRSASAPKQIRVGVIGTARACEGVEAWLRRIASGVAAKNSKQIGLFPAFPGFGNDTALAATLALDSGMIQTINQRHIDEAVAAENHNDRVLQLQSPFLEALRHLKEAGAADVVICALPQEAIPLMTRLSHESEDYEEHTEEDTGIRLDLHDSVKAQAMLYGKPTQLILPPSYGERLSRKILSQMKSDSPRLQDEATRAWNLYIAMYYKAGGIPWRMVRDSSALTTCYVGISFYRSLDRASVKTSLAEVFNQRGEGIIVRGGTARIDKADRQPHLNAEDAHHLLALALRVYRDEHHTEPARVVIHKSSTYTDQEQAGLASAAQDHNVEYVEFATVQKSHIRLFRNGNYPALRGTYLYPGEDDVYLYTRGSVPFYETYPGMYLPRMLRIQAQESQSTPLTLAEEILALTKMNWNDSQFDGSEPITLRGARKVGRILKYLEADDHIEPRYSFYM